MISSRPGPCWDDEARVFRPYVDPRLISCCAAEAKASDVYNLRLSGCSATAAVGLQLSSCCFPGFAHESSPAPPVCLQDRKAPLRSGKEKKKSTDNYFESWQQFALNGRDVAGGAVFGEIFTLKILPSAWTGEWIRLFHTGRQKEFWGEKNKMNWITLKSLHLRMSLL